MKMPIIERPRGFRSADVTGFAALWLASEQSRFTVIAPVLARLFIGGVDDELVDRGGPGHLGVRLRLKEAKADPSRAFASCVVRLKLTVGSICEMARCGMTGDAAAGFGVRARAWLSSRTRSPGFGERAAAWLSSRTRSPGFGERAAAWLSSRTRSPGF